MGSLSESAGGIPIRLLFQHGQSVLLSQYPESRSYVRPAMELIHHHFYSPAISQAAEFPKLQPSVSRREMGKMYFPTFFHVWYSYEIFLCSMMFFTGVEDTPVNQCPSSRHPCACPVNQSPPCCVSFQMTEQRKQKQRIGLLGHPPHMNVNPQQPAWRATPCTAAGEPGPRGAAASHRSPSISTTERVSA